MKCPQCGKNIAGKVNFCPWCGYKDENGAMQGKGIRNYATDLIDKVKSIDEAKKKKIIKISVISLIAVILIVTIVVLSVTLTSKFRVAKVSKVEIGMTMEEVEKILGKPDDEGHIFLLDYSKNLKTYVYMENKIKKELKKSKSKDIDEIESWEDFAKELDKEEKRQAKIATIKYKSIVICFDSYDKVVDVAFNTNTRYNESNPLYNIDEQKQSKEFSLNKTFIAKGQSISSADLQYTAKYQDGSYRKGKIVKIYGFSSSEEGVQTLSFDNNWEKKDISLTVKEANITVTSNNENWGTVKGTGYYLNGQDVTLTATPKGENNIFDGWYDGDTKLSAENPYTFKMNEKKEIVGKFSDLLVIENGVIKSCNINATSITIPDSVTSIGSYAFYNRICLTSITFGNSVTSIGEHAFYNCSGLTSITLGNSVTSIGDRAFCGCSSLTSITLGNSVTSIGDGAFYICSSLTSITLPDSVTSIGWNAFYGCSSLTNITLPDSVTSIGWSAFSSCSSLTSITIGNSVTSIGDYAFRDCSSLTSITFQGTKAQWNEISKDSDWDFNTGRYTVHCTDGDIEK